MSIGFEKNIGLPAKVDGSAIYRARVQRMPKSSHIEAATEAALKNQVRTLIRYGVNQRKLAEHLIVSESWLSRWLAGAEKTGVKVRPMSVPEMDRLRAYTRQLCIDLHEVPATSNPTQGAPQQHDHAVGAFRRKAGRR